MRLGHLKIVKETQRFRFFDVWLCSWQVSHINFLWTRCYCSVECRNIYVNKELHKQSTLSRSRFPTTSLFVFACCQHRGLITPCFSDIPGYPTEQHRPNKSEFFKYYHSPVNQYSMIFNFIINFRTFYLRDIYFE